MPPDKCWRRAARAKAMLQLISHHSPKPKLSSRPWPEPTGAAPRSDPAARRGFPPPGGRRQKPSNDAGAGSLGHRKSPEWPPCGNDASGPRRMAADKAAARGQVTSPRQKEFCQDCHLRPNRRRNFNHARVEGILIQRFNYRKAAHENRSSTIKCGNGLNNQIRK